MLYLRVIGLKLYESKLYCIYINIKLNMNMSANKRKSIMDWFSQSKNNAELFENVDTGKKIVHITKKNIITCILQKNIRNKSSKL